MIKLDSLEYAVRADAHVERRAVTRHITRSLGGHVLSTTGRGSPRIWKYTLTVPDAGHHDIREGEGTLDTLWATYMKTDPVDSRLEFWDERTSHSAAATCRVLIAIPDMPAQPIGQVLTDARYNIEIELVEAL